MFVLTEDENFRSRYFSRRLDIRHKEILRYFYETEIIGIDKEGVLARSQDRKSGIRRKLPKILLIRRQEKILAKEGEKYTKRLHKAITVSRA